MWSSRGCYFSSLLPFQSNFPGILPHCQQPPFLSISGYLPSNSSSWYYGYIVGDYAVIPVSALIGTECMDVFYITTRDNWSNLLMLVRLAIGSHRGMPRWMASLDCVYPGSLVATVSGLIRFAHLQGPGCEGFHHNLHLCAHCKCGFGDRNFHCGW
jgi:hypothetical protein